METREALGLISPYTAEQWGLVTTKQARDLGVDAVTLHRLRVAGFLQPVRYGVYASSAAASEDAREEHAVWLNLDPATPNWQRSPLDRDGGVFSHRSAARLHGLGDLASTRIEITAPRRRTSRDPDVWFKLATLPDDDVTTINGLPVTTVLRTVCDLLDQHTDGSHLATIISQAVRSDRLRMDVLADRIAPYSRRYGLRPDAGEELLEHLLAEIGTTTSELSRRPAPANTAVANWLGLTNSQAAAGAVPALDAIQNLVQAPPPALLQFLRKNTELFPRFQAVLELAALQPAQQLGKMSAAELAPYLQARTDPATLDAMDELITRLTGRKKDQDESTRADDDES